MAGGRWSVSCPCDSGYEGSTCVEQSEPTTWLAVILAVGTVLILFIAWGFRCQSDDSAIDRESGTPSVPHRTPLMREEAENIVAAAQPPTPRCSGADTTLDSVGSGPKPQEARNCCICMEKPIQV